MHSIERWGLYSKMERDDPNRATYVTGLTLRNALNMSVLGFGVADLAMGVGAVVIVMGVSTMTLGALALHWVTEGEEKRAAEKHGPATANPAMGY